MAEHDETPVRRVAAHRDAAAGDGATPPALHPIALGPNAAGDALRHLRTFVERERCGALPALAVVVEELVLNLVDHGDARTAALGFARAAGGVRLTLRDDGPPFDPREAPSPGDRPPARGGGAGLALVRAWSRDLSYVQEGPHNRLDLLVPYETPPASAPPA